jgi:hypothetical protein
MVKYRLYFAEDGQPTWKDRQETGPGYTFMDGFPEANVVRDPERAWSSPPRCN